MSKTHLLMVAVFLAGLAAVIEFSIYQCRNNGYGLFVLLVFISTIVLYWFLTAKWLPILFRILISIVALVSLMYLSLASTSSRERAFEGSALASLQATAAQMVLYADEHDSLADICSEVDFYVGLKSKVLRQCEGPFIQSILPLPESELSYVCNAGEEEYAVEVYLPISQEYQCLDSSGGRSRGQSSIGTSTFCLSE